MVDGVPKEKPRSEIIDIETSGTSCSFVPALPDDYCPELAVGFLLAGNVPVVCGGRNFNSYALASCYQLLKAKWEKFPSLVTPRYAAAIVTSPYQNGLTLLTGGRDSREKRLNNSEILGKDGQWSSPGMPDLPIALNYHCAVLYNSSTIFILGGYNATDNAINSTYIFNTESVNNGKEWIEGPSLSKKRARHGCGKIWKSPNERRLSLIVVGGETDWTVSSVEIKPSLDLKGYSVNVLGGPKSWAPLRSVEILDEGSEAWRSGPELPFEILNAALVEDPYGGVVLMGGKKTYYEYNDVILRLANAEDKWTVIPQKLNRNRYSPAWIPIPDALANCTVN